MGVAEFVWESDGCKGLCSEGNRPSSSLLLNKNETSKTWAKQRQLLDLLGFGRVFSVREDEIILLVVCDIFIVLGDTRVYDRQLNSESLGLLYGKKTYLFQMIWPNLCFEKIYNPGKNTLGQSCKTRNHRWFEHYFENLCYILKLRYSSLLPHPIQCWKSEQIAGTCFQHCRRGWWKGWARVGWISRDSLFRVFVKSHHGHRRTFVPRILSMIVESKNYIYENLPPKYSLILLCNNNLENNISEVL